MYGNYFPTLMLKLFQLWAVGASTNWLNNPLKIRLQVMLQSLYSSCPRHKNLSFLQKAWTPSSGEGHLDIIVQALGVVTVT